jgi:hypothetical protein
MPAKEIKKYKFGRKKKNKQNDFSFCKKCFFGYFSSFFFVEGNEAFFVKTQDTRFVKRRIAFRLLLAAFSSFVIQNKKRKSGEGRTDSHGRFL